MNPLRSSRSHAARWWRALWPVLVVVAGAVTCDVPTALRHRASLALVPAFDRAWLTHYNGLVADSVRLTVTRPPSTVLAQKTLAFDPNAAFIDASITVTLNSSHEQLQVLIEFLSGSTVMFTGTQLVDVTAGSTTTQDTVPLVYIGPGKTIKTIHITPRDTSVLIGLALPYTVTAIDSANQSVSQFYVHWSTSRATDVINGLGVLTSATAGTGWVYASTPTGIRDSTTITVAGIVPTNGTIQVGVTGLVGSPVSGGLAIAQRTDAAGTPIPIVISGAGSGSASAPAGTYTITYTPPAGFQLAGGVINPQTGIVVSTGATANVTFGVVASASIFITVPGGLIGVGDSALLQVRLFPTPSGPVTVAITSDSTQYVTVSAPGAVSFASGDTLKTIRLHGIALGASIVHATAAGYSAGITGVGVTPNFILLASPVTVGVGLSTTDSIHLFPAAPAGGLAIALISSDTTLAKVTTPTVNFTAGQSAGVATVQGVAAGTAVLQASAAGYADGAALITVTSGGAPNTLTKTAGDGLTAFINDTTTVRPQVKVLDAVGAPLTGVQVLFTVLAGGGTINALPVQAVNTNASGAATAGPWKMGGTAGADSLLVSIPTAPGIVPVKFAATATLPPPVIQLAVFGSKVVGVGRTGVILVRLLQAAPAGGLKVVVTSDSTQYLTTTAQPDTVVFAQGDTLQNTQVNGVAQGTTIMHATAPGYTAGQLTVPVSLNLITTPVTLNVPLTQTVALPVNLSFPAGVGGVKVAIQSQTPATVQVLTDTVTIAQGSSVANAQVKGLALGSAFVIATNPNYAPSQSNVSVTASLNIVQTSISPNASFGDTINVRLESGGSPVSAPAGGVPISFTSGNAPCVAVPANTSIAAGFVSQRVTVVYGGSATLPCNAKLYVSGPVGFATDSVTVSVGAQPAVIFGGINPIGSGLQRSLSVSVSVSNHGGTSVHIVSSDSNKLRLALNDSTTGTGSIDVPFAVNQTFKTYFVQALEGFTNDSITLAGTATAFVAATSPQVHIFQPTFDLIGVPGSANTLTAPAQLYVRTGASATAAGTFMNTVDPIRFGGVAVTARLSVTDSTIAHLLTSPVQRGDTSTVQILPRQSNSPTTQVTGGVQVAYLNAGQDTVRATIPGYRAVSTAINAPLTVTQPSITLGGVNPIGSGLQRSLSVSLSNAAPAGGVTVVVRPTVLGKVKLSPNDSTAGADSVAVTFAPGQSFLNYYLQALEGFTNDSLGLTATATGFSDGSVAKFYIYQPTFDLIGVPGSANTLTAPAQLYVRVGAPSTAAGTFMNTVDPIRFGGVAVTATLSVKDSTIAHLVTSPVQRGDTSTVQIVPRQTNSPTTQVAGGVQLAYLAAGFDTVRATIPGFRAVSSALNAPVTVTQPSISLGGVNPIGSGLQRSLSVSLSNPAPSGGVTVVVRPTVLGKVKLAPNDSTAGADSVAVTFATGQSFLSYYLQALEGITNDSLGLTATATGFGSGSVAKFYIYQPILDLINVPTTATTFDANRAIYVRVGAPNTAIGTFMNTVDPVRFGATALTATITSSTATVAQLTTNGQTGSSVTVQIAPRQSNSPTTKAAGGAEIDYLTAGQTIFAASVPTVRSISTAIADTLTVSLPSVGIGPATITVGSGLQVNASLSFSATAPTGDTVIVKSSNPAIVKIAPDAVTAGTDSIVVVLGNPTTFLTFYVQGLEGQTGSVGITASAVGFTSGNATVNVVQPAFDLIGLPTSGRSAASSADDPFYVRVGVPNAPTNTFLNSLQAARVGGPGISVSVSNGTPAVATLKNLAGPQGAGPVTLTIAAGQSNSPTTVASGGASLDYLTQGTTTITITIAGFVWVNTQPYVVAVGP